MSTDTPNLVARVDRRARIAGAAPFLTNGALFANLVPRFPEIKAAIGIDNAVYGVAVAGTVLTGLGSIAAGLAPPPPSSWRNCSSPVPWTRSPTWPCTFTACVRSADTVGSSGAEMSRTIGAGRHGPPLASLRLFPAVGHPAERSRSMVPSRSRSTRSGRMKWPPSGSCAS